jgi:peptide/nickel transport system substrate-binding protein
VQKKRGLSLLLIFLALIFAFSAVSAQDATNLGVAWPYQVPPTGHLNMFATNRLDLGIHLYLRFPNYAIYHWASGEYEGQLADTFGYDEDNNYVLTLKDGISWSDGNPLTSKDVVDTFNILYLLNDQIWQSVSGVEAVDDLTVKFTVTAPSLDLERRILTQRPQSSAVYGEISATAAELIAAGGATGEADFDAAVTELTEFRPEVEVSVGPYTLDPSTITDANIILVKNEGGYAADTVLFDTVTVWNGETEQVTPLVAAGDVSYATHGFPPATEASFIDAGIDIIRGPGYTGPALYFNLDVAPFDRVEVRQAIAHAIDREPNGFVSLGESGVAVEYMTGISDSLAEGWLSEETLDALNPYDYDVDAAAALLEGIGFTRDADGMWMDDAGEPLAFELSFPAEFADWSAAAENAVQQLNDFGFDITGTAVQFQQHLDDVYASNFEMAIRGWGQANPFPGQSYLYPYFTLNGQGEVAGEEAGGGINFDTNVTYSGGELDVYEAAVAAGQGLDTEAQAALVEQLAQSYNELVPYVQLWERYGNNPLNRSNVEAPPADDPETQNPWSGTDAFIPYWVMTGQLGPAA